MLDVFGGLRRVFRRRTVSIDNAVFRLHWMLTSVILVSFSLAVTSKQYLGDPVACFRDEKFFTARVVDTYCWIHSTFTIPSAFNKKVGEEVIYPGIENSKNSDRKYYPYYQWVCFVLFVQGVFFCVPYYLWSMWEGGLLRAVTLNMHIAVVSAEERKLKKKIILEYLCRNLRQHRMYAFKYFFCEFLCFFNVVGQMTLMDVFFDDEFLSYGVDVIRFAQMDQEERVDPMIRIFPRMTKCTIYTFGTSGSIEKRDILCLLPLNNFNEKIYIFLWFWFTFLALLTAVVLFARLMVILIPQVRPHMLHARCRLAFREHINIVMRRTNVGDWFLLYMLGKNLDSVLFKEIVADLAKRVQNKEEADGDHLV